MVDENDKNIVILRSIDSFWELTVDLNGGRIVELKYKNMVILGTFDRVDGKKGNTHICCPNFGNEGVGGYGLPFHGPGRNAEWKIEEAGSNRLVISYVMDNIGKYLGKLTIQQKFVLENERFKQEISIKNEGEEAVPANVAIHNYWNSPNGWDGVKINGKNVSDTVCADAFMDIEKENLIEIPGLEKIKLIQNGMPHARLWAGRKDHGGKIVYDQKYVCIEPARGRDDKGFFGSLDSLLPPESLISVSQSVCILEG